ncbi:tetratricopeptide repeat protein [Kribbella solani]|uniref:Tetratricopeptide (TPR) repeat protein n=1 Tax=Kribbella solani TaxID=236067 RepID=A0A841DYD2_9ACTN|nr:tetratricopeptide repeat protein [Kribbella solani]MBB5981207.1 tetratricopeptide (TPR) repeat protein [Kribbella solani]MDX2968735.1 tetratricopeptide repeat protein [Kribbella solani]
MTTELTPELAATIEAGFARRDRANMGPTIAFFEQLLAEHPDNPYVLYEVGGSYDTAGQEETAVGYYERALPGLSGETRRKCLLQYGSTLRNLGRYDESLAIFKSACAEFPESDSLRVFKALTLHAAGMKDKALATLLLVIADKVDTADLKRYEAAIRGNAEYLS